MKIQLRIAIFLLFIVPIVQSQAQALTNRAAATNQSESASTFAASAFTARQVLENIRHGLEQDDFLKNAFYDPDRLQTWFGAPYTCKPIIVPQALNIRVVGLDSVTADGDNTSQSKVAGVPPVTPLFSNGKIYLTDLARNEVIAHFVINVNVVGDRPDLILPDLVESVFGKPTSITAVVASNEDADSDTDRDTKKEDRNDGSTTYNKDATSAPQVVSPMANSWLNYQTQSGDRFRNVLFRTNADGIVAEIQIYVGRTQ